MKQAGLNIVIRKDRVEALLWREHINTPSKNSRLKLFKNYEGFAKKIAREIYYRRPADNFEIVDIEQWAYEGLLQSIDRFDPLRSAHFSHYAKLRIKGCINNGLSKTSEANAHYSYKKRVENERLKSLNEDIDSDSISALSQLTSMIAIGLILESGSNDEKHITDQSPSAYDSLAWSELEQAVLGHVKKLPENEEFIVYQHYINGINFGQIANIMSLSKGRISQLHRQALLKMRSKMAKFR